MKRFTAPDGWDVFVNVGAVEMVHAVRMLPPDCNKPYEGPLKQGTKIIFVSGQFQYVRELVGEVLKVIEEV